MESAEKYFVGVDIGTQGARVTLLNQDGNVVAESSTVFELDAHSREEQCALHWWKCCQDAIKEVIEDASAKISIEQILALAVTSTSGTVLPIDVKGNPLHHALMYSDQRSAASAIKCKTAAIAAGADFNSFSSSTGLAKIVWYLENFPQMSAKIHKFIHAADYITGKFCGNFDFSDYTNAFKTGYDLIGKQWPTYLFSELGLKPKWLPKVVPSGTVIGYIDPLLARELNLPNTLRIVTGITDGCASQIAAGATKPGQWNTTIGTTMVIKGVSTKQIKDDQGRVYSHLHPSGYWMPGGASNTGADWVTNEFGAHLPALNKQALSLIPTDFISYPLRQRGERFPFISVEAHGFEPGGLSEPQRYTANMEGVAYLERYAYTLLSQLSEEKIDAIFTAGGASNSQAWLTIRSSVLNLPIHKMKHTSGSVGAAILAASSTYYDNLEEAANAMNQIELSVNPIPALTAQYELNYHRFIATLTEKGWLKKEEIYA